MQAEIVWIILRQVCTLEKIFSNTKKKHERKLLARLLIESDDASERSSDTSVKIVDVERKEKKTLK